MMAYVGLPENECGMLAAHATSPVIQTVNFLPAAWHRPHPCIEA